MLACLAHSHLAEQTGRTNVKYKFAGLKIIRQSVPIEAGCPSAAAFQAMIYEVCKSRKICRFRPRSIEIINQLRPDYRSDITGEGQLGQAGEKVTAHSALLLIG